MANKFLTPDIIARQALATLYETTVMAPLVYRDVEREFTDAKIGDTVNIRKPATFEAKDFDQATGIELQDATEGSIPVVLNKFADVSFAVTSKDLTLEIEDFDAQLLTPALEAISQKVDRDVLSLRDDITAEAGITDALNNPDGDFDWFKPEVLIEAGRILDTKNVPDSMRHAVIGSTMKARWKNSEWIKHADKSGTTEALRRGSIGRDILGFDVFHTQNVKPAKANPAVGEPTTEVGIAFHPTALCLASAPLEIAPGSNASTVYYKGLSIRVAVDYDIRSKKTICSLDTLYGVKTIDPSRAVLLKGNDKA